MRPPPLPRLAADPTVGVLVVAAASRLGAFTVAAIAISVSNPARNPLLEQRAWHPDPFAPHTLVGHLARLGDRWDASWYLRIADKGYGETVRDAAFFPLYPTLIAGLGGIGLPPLLAATVVSFVAFAATAVLLGRLVELLTMKRCPAGEHAATAPGSGSRTASLFAVAAWAWLPPAVVLGAAYPESLLCALVAATWWLALSGRRRTAGLLCGLALLTKPLGVIALPLLLAGAREGDRRDCIVAGAIAAACAATWPLLLWWRFGDPLRFAAAQSEWDRATAPLGPLTGGWEGLTHGMSAAAAFARAPLDLSRSAIANFGDPVGLGMQDAVNLAAVIVLLGLGALAWRVVGRAAGASVLLCALVPLSTPSADIPLLSAPRFLLVAVPAFVALGIAMAAWPRRRDAVLAASAAGSGTAVALWSTWQWIG